MSEREGERERDFKKKSKETLHDKKMSFSKQKMEL